MGGIGHSPGNFAQPWEHLWGRADLGNTWREPFQFPPSLISEENPSEGGAPFPLPLSICGLSCSNPQFLKPVMLFTPLGLYFRCLLHLDCFPFLKDTHLLFKTQLKCSHFCKSFPELYAHGIDIRPCPSVLELLKHYPGFY